MQILSDIQFQYTPYHNPFDTCIVTRTLTLYTMNL